MLNLWHAVLLLLTIALAKVDLSTVFSEPEEEDEKLGVRACVDMPAERCINVRRCSWDDYYGCIDKVETYEPTPNPTWHPIPTWPPTDETPEPTGETYEPTANPTWHPIPTWPPTDETPEPTWEALGSSTQQLATKQDVANIEKTTVIGFAVVGGIVGLYLLGRACMALVERRRANKEMAKLETPLIQDATKTADSKRSLAI